MVCALLALYVSWSQTSAFQTATASGSEQPLGSILTGLVLVGATLAAYHFPLHLHRQAKVYMASVPYYLMAVLLMPALGATAAGLGALVGELSVRRERGNSAGTIASEVGRRVLVVLLGALVAHVEGAHGNGTGMMHAFLLALAAVVLWVGDVVTFPLILTPITGERPGRLVAVAARESCLVEGAQYLTGLLGALAALKQGWTLALLLLPTVLVYLAFRSMAQAREAQRLSEEAQAQAERAQHLAEQARARAEDARRLAEEAVRVRDDFLTAASHDLRTPLTSIMGRTEVIQMRLEMDRPVTAEWLRAQMHPLQYAARRMVAAVEEITDAAQLQMGQPLALRVEAIDVGEMVQNMSRLVSEASRWPGAAPVVVDASVEAVVHGDRARLERVAQNIIGNAVKYSPGGAAVHVGICRRGDWIIISVRDQGVGIPADELPHIFTQFYRASTSIGTAGAGIGLAGARTIVTQHGGEITVTSAVGRGTTVEILLPCSVPHSNHQDGIDAELRPHGSYIHEPVALQSLFRGKTPAK